MSPPFLGRSHRSTRVRFQAIPNFAKYIFIDIIIHDATTPRKQPGRTEEAFVRSVLYTICGSTPLSDSAAFIIVIQVSDVATEYRIVEKKRISHLLSVPSCKGERNSS